MNFNPWLFSSFGRLTGFAFVVVSYQLVFVSRAGASFVSLRQLTKNIAAISPSYHFNPGRGLS
jgi:hypothetical protein